MAPACSTAPPDSSSRTPPGSPARSWPTRWTAQLGGLHPDDRLTVTRTIRTRVLALAGRLINRSGRHVLRLPERWPWASTFTVALDKIRSLPLAI